MPFRWPDFFHTKTFILGASALALTLYLSVILLASGGLSPHRDKSGQTVTMATAKSLKSDFGQSFDVAQQGQFDTAWYKSRYLMIDIRPREEYVDAHVSGALSAPLSQLKYSVFTTDTKLVVYSTSAEETSQALPILAEQEVKAVRVVNTPLDTLEKEGVKLTKNSASP